MTVTLPLPATKRSESRKPRLMGRRTKTHRTAMLIASQLRRKDLHWKNWTPIDNSLSITLAYQIIRQLKEQGYVLYEIGFTDRKGNFKRRIVLMDWNARHQVKGTGRPTKPGQRLFCDVARIAAGVPDTISAYQDKIDYIIKAE